MTPMDEPVCLLDGWMCARSQTAVIWLCVLMAQDGGSSLAIFTGEEEVFAFKRTLSRLTEMQTEEYWLAGDRNSK